MADLTGQQIKNTFYGVLNIGATGATASLAQVTDGDGTAIPLQVSTSEIAFTGNVSGVSYPIVVQDEGSTLTSAVGMTGINFTGPDVLVTAVGDFITVAISSTSGTSGSSGTSGIDTAQISTNAQTDNYTLVLADRARNVQMTSGSNKTITIPPASSVNYPDGSQIVFTRGGAGEVTITPGSGVTVQSSANRYRLRYQYSGASAFKVTGDTWYLFGDLKL
jgi:hypothetical protein